MKWDLESSLTDYCSEYNEKTLKKDYKLELVETPRCQFERQTFEKILIPGSNTIAITTNGDWKQH